MKQVILNYDFTLDKNTFKRGIRILKLQLYFDLDDLHLPIFNWCNGNKGKEFVLITVKSIIIVFHLYGIISNN